MPEIPQRLRRRMWLRRSWLRRTLPAGVVAILVVGGTVVVRNSANASPIDTYRTTTVTTGSVEQRLDLTGSAQRVNQVSQGFAVTGTVSSVSVSVGDTVTAGEVLVTLDSAPLRSAVTSATASLAKAKATLESDQSTTTTAPTDTGSTGGTSTSIAAATAPVSTPVATASPATSPRVAATSGGKGAGTSLAQAQQRVTSAQQAITDDLRRASAALTQCAPFLPSESTTSSASPTTTSTVMPTPTTTPTSTSTSTSGPTPSSTSPSTATPTSTTTASPISNTTASTSTPSEAEISACVSALRTAPTQQQIQRHQQALTDSQSALMTTVTLAITTATNTANTPPNTTNPSTSSGQSSTRQSAASGSSGSQTPGSQSSGSQSPGSQTDQSTGGLSSGTGQSSASRAVTDQAAVTNAEAALSSAQADLTSATLKSSIGGTVGSVSLVKGASSQGKTVVIVGTGAVEVTVEVPLASIGNVRVGQKANVTPQGATSIAAGSVTSISLLPSTSSSSTGTGGATGQATSTTSSPTYPVVVLVPEALPALATGSRADVSLVVGTVSKVLTVPNSALTPLAKGQAMAQTLKNGVVTPALVKTGYAGTLATQVTSGLSAGQQVVLADLSEALPTNTTSSRRLGVGGAAGGLGGAGLGGAGLGGGATAGGGGFPPAGFPPAG